MCFILDDEYDQPLVAEKNIICFKQTDRFFKESRFKSNYYDFNYEAKKLYAQPEPLKIHQSPNPKFHEIREGFHSYRNPYQLPSAVFIIPKGASYYVNPSHDAYVSDEIIYSGILLRKNRTLPVDLQKRLDEIMETLS